MLKKLASIIYFIHIATSAYASSIDKCGVDGKSCLEYGAVVFQQRCTLCHGSDGLGEGMLPLSIKGYPPTNLMNVKLSPNKQALLEVIKLGGSLEGVSKEMPPWGDELTHAQLESVAVFVSYLRQDLKGALQILKSTTTNQKPTLKIGRGVYKSRCSLCHGKQGEGDGKMARIIKNPPPFNLTLSRTSDDYLYNIITQGGEKVGRSNRMPPWGGDLTEIEIQSLIIFIKTLRREI